MSNLFHGLVFLFSVFLFTAAVLIAASPSGAQAPTIVGNEFQINTYTTDRQSSPQPAMRRNGEFVVVWTSAGGAPGDFDTAAQGRLFDSLGNPQGAEFTVAEHTTGVQSVPHVVSDENGDFLAVWSSDGSPGNDQDGVSVQARRFRSDGLPIGGQFQVNTYTTGDQRISDVARSDQGDVLIVWSGFSTPGADDLGIVGRFFDSAGSPIGDDVLVNLETSSPHTGGSVAAEADGGFIVAWSEEESLNVSNIVARRFTSDGAASGVPFQVNTTTGDPQSGPVAATRPDGGFFIAWSGEGDGEDETRGVRGRLFGSDGNPVGDDYQLNSYTTDRQFSPSIAMEPSGRFVVAWGSYGVPDDRDADVAVVARRFEADGSPRGAEFQINAFTTNYQSYPQIATDSKGRFIVTWTSFYGGPGEDNWGVRGRRLNSMIFDDGFESGDLSAWSVR